MRPSAEPMPLLLSYTPCRVPFAGGAYRWAKNGVAVYYGYDDTNALTGKLLQPAGDTTYYVYDANGSLAKMVAPAGTTYYEYGPHRLVTRIAPPAGGELRFFYDGSLNRYKITRGGVSTSYLWEGLNQLEERDASGNLLARFTHGTSRIAGIGSVVEVERHVGEATYFQYFAQDHRGTMYKVNDPAGGRSRMELTTIREGVLREPEGIHRSKRQREKLQETLTQE
jgi:YD repeat-containing protein